MNEVFQSPETRLRHPWRVFPSHWFHHSFGYLTDLLITLAARELKLRYKDSRLGLIWTLVNPLLQLAVYYFAFRIVMQVEIPRYATFVFIGLLAYQWFQSSLTQAANTITDNRELVAQPGFPVIMLPIIAVTSNCVQFLAALPILIPLMLIEGSSFGASLLTLPLLIVLQFVITLGFGYLLAAFNVVFRDTQHILAVVLRLLLFLSPVFYYSAKVPEQFQALYRLNPLVGLIGGYRTILMQGLYPAWSFLLVWSVLAISLTYIGMVVFVRMSHRFVEEVGA